MLIKTQDKESFVLIGDGAMVYILPPPAPPGNGWWYVLVRKIGSEDDYAWLGSYTTKDDAMAELAALSDAIVSDRKLYEMP